jgi:apolipoprotein N-acyltransferase
MGVELVPMAALGALQTLAFVWTLWAWWLLPAAVCILAWRLNGATPRRAAAWAWAFGTGWLAAGVWWLFISMHRYGGLPAPLAAAAVLLLAAVLSVYMALVGAAYARWRSGRPAADALLLSGLWLAAELARGQWLTGFPWVASGYALVDAPLAAWAPWIGVYGLGALVVFLAAWPAGWLPARQPGPVRLLASPAQGPRAAPAGGSARLAWLLAVSVVVLAPQWLPQQFTRSTGEISVSLLQTAVPQDEKFEVARWSGTLDWLTRAVQASEGRLVVTPETAVPWLPDQLAVLAPGLWDGWQAQLAREGRAALVGIPLGDETEGYTNSVVGLGAAPPFAYAKHHLVPFGEFIPKGFRWFTELMDIPLGDFARGVVDAPSWAFGGQLFGPNICFEDLFGEELAVRLHRREDAPTVLVNISNIGWFGHTVALPQHLNISRLRALELQRPMLRATNTGVTAIVDHRGVVRAQLPAFEPGVLNGRVEGRTGLTPYADWAGRHGLLPLRVVAGLLVMAAFGLGRTRAP